MKKLLILSGKGGTGKTTTAAAFIAFAKARAFADCDVDAPNLHLITRLDASPERSDYYGSQKAVINAEQCIGCDLCAEHCRFDAIRQNEQQYTVDEYACEGCGVCESVCPVGAITLHDDISGQLELFHGSRVFSTAMLKMGRGNSGKLVTQVKTALTDALPDAELQIIDGSPGIGCPVIASVSGVDLVLVVTEPTLSGISDLRRILRTAAILGVKTAVCVNKADTCPSNTSAIESLCKAGDIPFTGCIPYDRNVSQAINAGHSVADVECPAKEALYGVFKRTMALIE